ncbi:hypothetical protein L6452_42060 [Arctium lappa]|uniref:Uncharacterized protein n=1 Tax=Arctium lappa TaxID=4217 RepID=A0ACB8XGQ9_ARCLA|nr:hypothetical protein L6452_42060 [Arctium lappa]
MVCSRSLNPTGIPVPFRFFHLCGTTGFIIAIEYHVSSLCYLLFVSVAICFIYLVSQKDLWSRVFEGLWRREM